ncbi:type IV secretion system protein TrbL [Mesorhizobium albiziae]|uniref:Type IV secretion system protein TrbL n=1 Tax=Neomesorhizobium albiziae TaxID=335020 RepID=A0A1I4EWB4_9HYPH|nr:P-type conjugative transfer protein TrbL [Mesorhizobium albiziae]GLS33457.1 conjugal transfer protein TrbL [Mesorhizobium albiziae]SFL09599.1 type IV secretion system protein TrbL [Mesorhizobium albiziae]
MDDLNVIDRFMETFVRYIDSGFGLLQGDVAFLTTILIGVDITLAGLFWAFDGEANIAGRLVRKVLYVGAFALILNNFAALATTVFDSFAGLGLHASANGMTAADLLKPGRLAGTGFEAAHPLLVQVSQLLGFRSFFNNFLAIIVLLVAWFFVIAAFFILAVQLFITILEFKLTALAGFVLVPFALWNRTSFLAERVLGSVVSSGIKVMVLAVIAGIGSGFFGEFISALNGQEPNIAQAMSLVLASLSLLGLGIFGPGIASGLVSGAPQLGAGAAIGTAGAAAGGVMLTGGAALAGARGLSAAGSGGLAAIRAGTAMGSAAATAFQLGQATSGSAGAAGVAAGLGGIARAGGGAAARGIRSNASQAAASLTESAQEGRSTGWRATGGKPVGGGADGAAETSNGIAGSSSSIASSAPDWAQRLRAEQHARAHRQATTQAIKDGDRPGGAANPDLKENED